jgi:itaconyl-CoA hydratase
VTTHPATLGRFFEDFVVGDVYQHPLGRTITEADDTWLTLLSMNTNQNHFNAHLAGQNPLTQGRVIVDSGLTIAVVLGISVLDMSQNAIANLEMTDVRLTHPPGTRCTPRASAPRCARPRRSPTPASSR